jgi:ectoine hydroxylase-related dioxygenase (phytanoyl-CoA dioxygenase family)
MSAEKAKKIIIPLLTDSTSLIGDGPALRARWEQDGVLFFRNVIDLELIARTREKFRAALAAEELIDPAIEEPIWTGKAPKTRRPCDALGTEAWHEFIKLPKLVSLMRDIFDGEPVWIPIAGHRSSMPTGPIAEGEDIFAGRHQDGYFNKGMMFATCWMPIRDFDINSGSFTVAPSTHKELFYSTETHKMFVDAIPDDAWRSVDFHVGDVLIFHYWTAHATLPNPSNLIRMSLDVRAIPSWAPQPIVGEVEAVEGDDVTIRTEDGKQTVIHVTEETFVRDMLPLPRLSKSDMPKIAFPGAHVMATADADGNALVLRRNWY